MLRRPRGPGRARGPADPGRWAGWCAAALDGRPESVTALLAHLRAADRAAQSRTHDRAAAVDAVAAAPARLLLLLDRYARPGAPATGPAGPLHLLLTSLDADGRVREQAVVGLAGTGGPLAAALLALRTADHVPEVGARAAAALALRTAPDEVAAAVPVLLGLGRRVRGGAALAAYRAVLAEPPHRRAVRALAVAADPDTRRFGVELALDLGEYVRGDLLRAALYDRDQVCRRLCAQRLLEIDPEQAGPLLGAGGAGVRELAVAALPGDVPAKRLVPLLADRARMVRAQARWQLYQRGEPPAGVYRRELEKALAGKAGVRTRLLAGLVAGLGECGEAADAALLARLLGDGRPAVRRAAARALTRIARAEDLPPLLGPLANDPDPGVAREVFEGLARAPHGVLPETLWIGRTRTEPAVRSLAARIEERQRAARAAAPAAGDVSGTSGASAPGGAGAPAASAGAGAQRAQSGHSPR
jgi:HEAT repeat protein